MTEFQERYDLIANKFKLVQDLIRETKDMLTAAGYDLPVAKLILTQLCGQERAEEIVSVKMSRLQPRSNQDVIWSIIEDGRDFKIGNETIADCNSLISDVVARIKILLGEALDNTSPTDVDAYNEIRKDISRLIIAQAGSFPSNCKKFEDIDPDQGWEEPGDYLFDNDMLSRIGVTYCPTMQVWDFRVFQCDLTDSKFSEIYGMLSQLYEKYNK